MSAVPHRDAGADERLRRAFQHFAERTLDEDAFVYAVLCARLGGLPEAWPTHQHALARRLSCASDGSGDASHARTIAPPKSANRAPSAPDPRIDRLLDLAALASRGNPPPNLIFGAVHELLLHPADEPDDTASRAALGEFYATVAGPEAAAARARELIGDDARGAARREALFGAFADFCRVHEMAIADRIRARRVQTNEVGRCPILLSGFGYVAQVFNALPLFLVEVGASAGLNLRFDHYAYTFSDGRQFGPRPSAVDRVGSDPASTPPASPPPTLRTEVRLQPDAAPPTPTSAAGLPHVAGRIGIDLNPIDVHDDGSMHWLEGLVWPEHVGRLQMLRTAIDIARRHPVEIVAGDAISCLAETVQRIPETAKIEGVSRRLIPCIFHSYTTYQMRSADRERFADLLDRLGRQHRNLACISLEWLGTGDYPRLECTIWKQGRRQDVVLAERCHHHGRWIDWTWRGHAT